MNDKKRILCSFGLPIKIVSKKKKLKAKILLNDRHEVVWRYYQIGDKIFPQGNGVYLDDVGNETVDDCYPKNIFLRILYYIKIHKLKVN